MNKIFVSLTIFAVVLSFSHAQTIGGYNNVAASQYNDTDIQKYMTYGIDKVIVADIYNGKINPNYGPNKFHVAQINSIQTQVVAGMNYKYNLTLNSTDEAYIINTVFVVYKQAGTNVTRLSSWTNTIIKNEIAGQYTTVPKSDYNNSEIQEFMQFGVQHTISQAIIDNDINSSVYNDTTFIISNITQIQTQVVNGINYKYELTLRSTDNAITIYTNFVVYSQAWTNLTQLSNLAFAVEYSSIGAYTRISPQYYSDAKLQGLMQFGVENVIAEAVKDKKIDSNYTGVDFRVAKIISISEKIVDGVDYRFNLILESNDKKVTIQAIFVVFDQSWTNIVDMVSSEYIVLLH